MIVVVFVLFYAGYKGYKEIKRKQRNALPRVRRREYEAFRDSQEYESDEEDGTDEWTSSQQESPVVGWNDRSSILSLT